MEKVLFETKVVHIGLCILLFHFSENIAQESPPNPQDVFATEPSFDVPTLNITVIEGEDATLPCSVDNLNDHKVVWTDQFSTLLTFGTARILDDDRISVERPYTEDWNLLIREVKYKDRGKYICQINTKPVKTKYVVLHVRVPPRIINEYSTGDVITREGETVTLVCNVTGVPPPTVHWYRQPLGQSSAKQKEKNQFTEQASGPSVNKDGVVGTNGEILIIHNVSRYCEGKYECLCFNEVPPAVKREMKVQVEFRPEIQLPNKRIGQYQKKDTILECVITAFPQAMTVWKRHGREIKSDSKYGVEVYRDELGAHRLTLSLRVKNISSNDYGTYSCYASNKLGEDQEEMILYEYIQIPRTTPRYPIWTEYNPTRTRKPGGYNPEGSNSNNGPLIVTKGTNPSSLADNAGRPVKNYWNNAMDSRISLLQILGPIMISCVTTIIS